MAAWHWGRGAEPPNLTPPGSAERAGAPEGSPSPQIPAQDKRGGGALGVKGVPLTCRHLDPPPAGLPRRALIGCAASGPAPSPQWRRELFPRAHVVIEALGARLLRPRLLRGNQAGRPSAELQLMQRRLDMEAPGPAEKLRLVTRNLQVPPGGGVWRGVACLAVGRRGLA